MKSPILSICLPVYNGEELLPDCLRSVGGAVAHVPIADRAKLEIILCDNHSTDHTREIAEKLVVSIGATVGIHNFRHDRDFVRAADQMIARNERVNGEFYAAPTYNQLIEEVARLAFCNVGSERDGMCGLGILTDLAFFNDLPVPSRAGVLRIDVESELCL